MRNTLLTSVSSAALFFMAATAVSAGSPIAPITVLPPLVDVAPAGSEWYASVFAGGGALQDVETDYSGGAYTVVFDGGYVVGATLGRHIGDNWRVEGELSYASYKANAYAYDNNDPDEVAEGPLNAIYLLANVWYDIPNSSRFTPYVGGGLGLAKIDADIGFDFSSFGLGDGETKFAYQVGAGVMYGLSDRMSLDVGYRYKAVDDVAFEDNGGGANFFEGGDVHTHTLQAGLSFDF